MALAEKSYRLGIVKTTGIYMDSSNSKTDQGLTDSINPLKETNRDQEFYQQWTHTGQFRDHGVPKAVCQLCGNTGLRYHFLIAHRETGEAMWIGSQCILNLNLSPEVVHVRKRRARKQSTEQVRNEINHQCLLNVLQEVHGVYALGSVDDQRRIRWIIGRYQRRGDFSPAVLVWLFQAMSFCGINPTFELYSVTLHTKKDRAEIKQMGITGLRLISKCLTDTQRKACESWGIRQYLTD